MRLFTLISFILFSWSAHAYRCFNTSTQRWDNQNDRISSCWDISRHYDPAEDEWFPTCDNSFALKIDPFVHGVSTNRDYWCPGGRMNLNLVHAIDGENWRRVDNECDPFKVGPRVIAPLWLLDRMEKFESNINSNYQSDMG